MDSFEGSVLACCTLYLSRRKCYSCACLCSTENRSPNVPLNTPPCAPPRMFPQIFIKIWFQKCFSSQICFPLPSIKIGAAASSCCCGCCQSGWWAKELALYVLFPFPSGEVEISSSNQGCGHSARNVGAAGSAGQSRKAKGKKKSPNSKLKLCRSKSTPYFLNGMMHCWTSGLQYESILFYIFFSVAPIAHPFFLF